MCLHRNEIRHNQGENKAILAPQTSRCNANGPSTSMDHAEIRSATKNMTEDHKGKRSTRLQGLNKQVKILAIFPRQSCHGFQSIPTHTESREKSKVKGKNKSKSSHLDMRQNGKGDRDSPKINTRSTQQSCRGLHSILTHVESMEKSKGKEQDRVGARDIRSALREGRGGDG